MVNKISFKFGLFELAQDSVGFSRSLKLQEKHFDSFSVLVGISFAAGVFMSAIIMFA